jgi:predicted TIM-barrel fold metal-dependent hydrolase
MGYAAVVPGNPRAAVDELQRAVTELGFKGWSIHSNYGDTMLDDPAYHPILEKAEELGVPVNIHPTVPAFCSSTPLPREMIWSLASFLT